MADSSRIGSLGAENLAKLLGGGQPKAVRLVTGEPTKDGARDSGQVISAADLPGRIMHAGETVTVQVSHTESTGPAAPNGTPADEPAPAWSKWTGVNGENMTVQYPWYPGTMDGLVAFVNDRLDDDQFGRLVPGDGHLQPTGAAKPGREQRQVQAGRDILADYDDAVTGLERRQEGSVEYLVAEAAMRASRLAVRRLATTWSDHPEYRPEFEA